MAARLGADAIGLVFHPGSRRCITPEAAAEIAAAVGPFVTTVALFLDAEPATIADVIERVRPDCIQFHGSETPAECARYGVPYIKAAGMSGTADLHAAARDYARAQGLLVDSHGPGEAGGTGETFEWSRLPGDLATPIILAGGLTPANVGEAVARVRPWAVDVSSGVERSPGSKDEDKLAGFMQGVQRGQGD
jgi:phosphoribosylanthranilate isomerase